MHDTALELGRLFFERYLPVKEAPAAAHILDIGSLDINGSLSSVVPSDRAVVYTGVDLEAGEGVDLVVQNASELPFPDATFDVVVSTSCFEHDEHFWLTFDEALRVLTPGGFLYLNAPSNGHFHQHPLDCWRFYPDAGLALARWANRKKGFGSRVSGVSPERPSEFFEPKPETRNPEPLVALIESFTFERRSCEWNDAVMVFGKLPLRLPLPEPLSRLPGACNIRRYGSDGIGRLELQTEDQRLGAMLGTMGHHLLSTMRADTALALNEGRPFFSVVVAFDQTTTDDETFERCLASLESQDVPLEVIIVHDGPLLRPMLRDREVLASEARTGLAGHDLRAGGMLFTRGLYILHANADFQYAPGALLELSAHLRAEPVGMLVAQVDRIGLERSVEGVIVMTDDSHRLRLTGHPPIVGNVDLMQVALRRGLAFSYGFPGRGAAADGELFAAISSEHGYCRSPILIGWH